MKEIIIRLAIKKYPNDYDLGGYLRSLDIPELHETMKKFPNDYNLGREIRSWI